MLFTLDSLLRIGVVVAAAIGGSALTTDGLESESYRKSSYQPPNWTFGVVWTIIYVTYAAAWVYLASNITLDSERNLIDVLFTVNMIINFAWVYIFFYLSDHGTALWVLVLLILVLLGQIYLIYNAKGLTCAQKKMPLAVLALYTAWCGFATFLNATLE